QPLIGLPPLSPALTHRVAPRQGRGRGEPEKQPQEVRRMRYNALPALIVLSLGSPLLGADAMPMKVTYEHHVLPLLREKCIGCHNHDKQRGGLNLASYTRLMEGSSAGAVVKPGDVANSSLYLVITHQREPFMPPR